MIGLHNKDLSGRLQLIPEVKLEKGTEKAWRCEPIKLQMEDIHKKKCR